MSKSWVVGAQLSTSHSPRRLLTIDRAMEAIDRVTSSLELDLLIVGADEIPELFRSLTNRVTRPAHEVFLWFNLLSDIPDMLPSDLVINWRGELSRGWGGWAEQGAEVRETFRFACPNNPQTRQKTLTRIGQLLAQYPFDGVFLDKMRFSSPANGMDEVASCFCSYCRSAAARTGLDLQAVAELFERRDFAPGWMEAGIDKEARSSIDALLNPGSLLARFVRFRCESITGFVRAAYDEASRHGRKVALDLFVPGLAPIVGQDYPALAEYCTWAKPMSYRTALGPASLRLEIASLSDGLSKMLGLPQAKLAAWCSRHLQGFSTDSIAMMKEQPVSLQIVTPQIAAAVQLIAPVPVYFGLELVRIPGVIDITPTLVNDMVMAGRAANAAGAIISWDIMHAPQDGIQALGAAL
jgi:hypothetical protein